MIEKLQTMSFGPTSLGMVRQGQFTSGLVNQVIFGVVLCMNLTPGFGNITSHYQNLHRKHHIMSLNVCIKNISL